MAKKEKEVIIGGCKCGKDLIQYGGDKDQFKCPEGHYHYREAVKVPCPNCDALITVTGSRLLKCVFCGKEYLQHEDENGVDLEEAY